MPAKWDPTLPGPVDKKTGQPSVGNWEVPDWEVDPLKSTLFRIVRRKQPHVCTPIGEAGCRAEGVICAGHFPQPVQTDKMPKEDAVERCYRYYCPGHEHRNIGPYIPVSSVLHI